MVAVLYIKSVRCIVIFYKYIIYCKQPFVLVPHIGQQLFEKNNVCVIGFVILTTPCIENNICIIDVIMKKPFTKKMTLCEKMSGISFLINMFKD